MYTNKYDFQCMNAIKIILRNSEGKVLLIQEPENNNWMPLHWGLPGGKPTETESLLETFQRKVKTDIGQNAELKGLFSVKELIMDHKTVLMYIVVAECTKDEVSGEAKEYKWMDKSDIEKMQIKEFTEFFNKNLLMEYFANPNKIIPFNFFDTYEYYKMGNDIAYNEWFKSGTKN